MKQFLFRLFGAIGHCIGGFVLFSVILFAVEMVYFALVRGDRAWVAQWHTFLIGCLLIGLAAARGRYGKLTLSGFLDGHLVIHLIILCPRHVLLHWRRKEYAAARP